VRDAGWRRLFSSIYRCCFQPIGVAITEGPGQFGRCFVDFVVVQFGVNGFFPVDVMGGLAFFNAPPQWGEGAN